MEIDRRNPELCRFTSARTLYVGTRTVNGKLEAKGLPLAEKLVNTSGVEKIQLIGHLLVVTRTAEREWNDLGPEIHSILTSYLVSGQALTPDDVNDQMMLIGRSTREKVQDLLHTQINPGVAEPGGTVPFIGVKVRDVHVRLHGGCQGCGVAGFTFKQGIEFMVKCSSPEA